MAGSSDGMLEALQAGIDALEDDEPTVAPLVTIETLAERIAHLDSPALQGDTPVSKPKLPMAFATGPPLVGSPELVDLSSIASPVASEVSDDERRKPARTVSLSLMRKRPNPSKSLTALTLHRTQPRGAGDQRT